MRKIIAVCALALATITATPTTVAAHVNNCTTYIQQQYGQAVCRTDSGTAIAFVVRVLCSSPAYTYHLGNRVSTINTSSTYVCPSGTSALASGILFYY